MKKRFCLLLLAILESLILSLSGAENLVKRLPDANSAGFKEAIIYEPLGNDRIRLAGDSDYYNHGLVKVFRNNTWGYVCDDDWDIKDANVACRQLGFNRGAAKFVSASWYGEAEDGLYLMDDVKCAGDEKRLQKCSYNIDHDCDKNEAAGVICNLNTGCEDQWIAGPTGCYRLFNGSMSRYDAENKCKSMNGQLAKIETQEENNFLSSILRMEKEKHYWLTDGIKEQNWIWKTDGKPISSSFWFPGWEPQSQFPKPSNNTLKRCLALANAFKYKDSKYLSEYFYWDDINCNNVGNFICETEKTKIPSDAEYMKCSNDKMFCDSSKKCIPLVWECDGDNDCPGGEDESNCDSSKCSENQMFCTFQTICIPLTWKCDDEIDCHGGEDESNCNFRKCSQDQIPCTNSDRCILPSWKCDGEKDCLGGEDETNCDSSKCSQDQMYCASSSRCISLSWKCDGDKDCPGGEDESNCYSSKCSQDQMYCASSSRCISLSWKCDGDKDCPGGEDESNCSIKVELVDGSSELSGRIEITRNGIKGTVCDDEFDDNDATVICRMLGHGSGEIIPNIFGYGEGTIWLDNLNCTGSEYDLEVCPNLSWGDHDCTHKGDVAIKCFKKANTTLLTTTSIPAASSTDRTSIKVDLVDGSSEHSGRIEITRNGIKGTVCDDEFDDNDATVICRMLGHSSGEIIPNIFGYGEGTIWLDNLNCTGSEYDLEVCPNLSWGDHDCTHKGDVAIKCLKKDNTTLLTTTSIPAASSTDPTDIRVELVDGSSELSGRIEITRNGIKGTVCDDEFDDNDATVICRMLGHSSGEIIPNIFGYGEGTIWLDNLNCTGSEYDLEVCPNLSWGDHDCTHKEDVAIKCLKKNNTTLLTTTSIPAASSTDPTDIRVELVDGSSELSGRIEITRNGIKGTVCDDEFDDNDATVICRMLGLSSGEIIPNIFGYGEGTIWLDNLNCTGSEYDLEVCPNLSWGDHDCTHKEDVAIKCLKKDNTTLLTTTSIPAASSTDPTGIKVDLVDGSSEHSGRIEITRNGIKGTVCDDEFDDNDATVICRMLGHSSGEIIPNIFGYGEGTIWLDNLNCTGSEYDLEVCPNLSWGDHDCTHKEDVAIKCLKKDNTTLLTTTSIPAASSTDPTDIRVELVDGSSELSGRIEITRNGIKGTVCDDEFDDNDATVICRMLGHSSGEIIPNIFGYGEGTIWLDNLNCTGSEYDLEVCPNLSWGDHDCTHKEDVAIKCLKKDNTTLLTTTSIPAASSTDPTGIKVDLVDGSSEHSGRIEITRNGIKGTVCDDEFDDNDATVICRMLGHSSGEIIPNIFGYGEGTIWLDNLNCTGSEYDLDVCPNLSWGDHDCTHKEDVAIKCFKEANTTSSTDQNVTCGRRPIKQRYQRISGGQVAKYGAFPWQARILEVWFLGKLHHCGAAIINEFWLLTAAHCMKKNMKKENMLLQTGDLNSKTWDAHEQSFQAEHLITHPLYNSLTHDYDIGLIKLRPDSNGNGIVFNDYVQPACLPPQNLSMSVGTHCEISGWGSTGQIYSSMLKAATVPVLSPLICELIYNDITPRMFCAGYLEGGIDTCQGDSGGPLVCSVNGVHTLIGITSSGNGCARLYNPGVYTNVAYLKPWIMATLAEYS